MVKQADNIDKQDMLGGGGHGCIMENMIATETSKQVSNSIKGNVIILAC